MNCLYEAFYTHMHAGFPHTSTYTSSQLHLDQNMCHETLAQQQVHHSNVDKWIFLLVRQFVPSAPPIGLTLDGGTSKASIYS